MPSFEGIVTAAETLSRKRAQLRIRRAGQPDLHVALDRSTPGLPDPVGTLVSSSSNSDARFYRFTTDNEGTITAIEPA